MSTCHNVVKLTVKYYISAKMKEYVANAQKSLAEYSFILSSTCSAILLARGFYMIHEQRYSLRAGGESVIFLRVALLIRKRLL